MERFPHVLKFALAVVALAVAVVSYFVITTPPIQESNDSLTKKETEIRPLTEPRQWARIDNAESDGWREHRGLQRIGRTAAQGI